jgi:exopolyphosphatase / guanosine-5'-triphosphate,3'-diphosphate pyrophosphatase
VAGTLTTIAQVSMGDRRFNAERVHGFRLEYHHVHRLLERLRSLPLREVVALGIPEGRADVILMGTLILHQFMRLSGAGEVTVSIQGLRFGMAQQELLRLRQKITGN